MAFFGRRLDRTQFVDTTCPVEWSSPLNRGLVSWWMVIPGWGGGTLFRDIIRGWKKPNDGTLTNGPTWQGARGRPGGFGCLEFNGSTQYGTASVNLSAYSTLTLSFWLYWNSYANDYDMAFEYTADGVANSGFYVSPNSNSGAGRVEIAVGPLATVGAKEFARPSAAAWHHWAVCLDRGVSGGVSAVYIDGASVSLTTTNAGIPGGAWANSTLYAMSRAGTTFFGAGKMDDVRLYNRALSAREVAAIYDDSRRGYPETLRRVRRTVFGIAAAPGTPGVFNPAWCGNTNKVMSVGRGF